MGSGVNREAACSGAGGSAPTHVCQPKHADCPRDLQPRGRQALLCGPALVLDGARAQPQEEALRPPSLPVGCGRIPWAASVLRTLHSCGRGEALRDLWCLEEPVRLSCRTRCKQSFRKKREHPTPPSVEASSDAGRRGVWGGRPPGGSRRGGGQEGRGPGKGPPSPRGDTTRAPNLNFRAMTESGPQGEGGSERT